MIGEILQPGCFDESTSWLLVCGLGDRLSQAVSWSVGSIRERGLWTTLRVAASVAADRFFDWRYGTETLQAVNTDDLDTSSANQSRALRYKATRARPFVKLLRRLKLPHDAVFVDFGSGKGRVLLLAAQYGFKRVVGVEFSPGLCVQARKNIEVFQRKVRLSTPIEVVETDATEYEIHEDENVFFFYNPFDAVILGRVIEQLRHSLAAHPRRVWLIYCTPIYARVIEETGLFPNNETHNFGGTEFRIYSNPAQSRI